MRNFAREYPQGIERAGWGCIISMRSIRKVWKMWDVDAIIHVRQAEKHLQVMKGASCRYIGLKKSICNSEYQGSVDTSAAKRVSATEHIKAVQIHQFPKEYLQQNILRYCRYIRS